MGRLMPFASIRQKPSADGEFVMRSYTGEYETDVRGYIRFLSDGVLVVENDTMIDAFLVGGGAGGYFVSDFSHAGAPGGGAGNTETRRKLTLYGGREYPIRIGEGTYGNGEDTTAFGARAKGGTAYRPATGASDITYPDGGSGGGGVDGAGGTDGGSGAGLNAGRGQGRTARLFGEADGELFAGGGAGGASLGKAFPAGGVGGGGNADPSGNVDGLPNTGGGGAGGSWYSKDVDLGNGEFISEIAASEPGKGGSGVVIIRRAV
jgi:hypothetical protein